ncbi:MAG: hypothetical protein RLY31_1993 [Bacteroidota bacterium]|jgi:hypothetical protein
MQNNITNFESTTNIATFRRMKPISFLALAASLLFLPGCEKEVDFDFDDRDKLVVISHFTENKTLDVLVYKTDALSNEAPSVPAFVTDATVMVFEKDEFLELLELAPGSGEGSGRASIYRSRRLTPETGKLYTIRVSVPGFDPITAANSIPVPVPIASVLFNSNLTEANDAGSGSEPALLDFEISVAVQDPAEVKNFYHLIFHQELFPYTVSSGGDTIVGMKTFAQPNMLQLKDPDLPVIKNYDNRGFLADDRHFNGEKLEIGAVGSYRYDPSQYLAGDFLVELRTVSEAYFFHYSTLTLQGELGNNPLGEGVVIYDNIENGVGIFAGYSSSVNSFRLFN